MIRSRPATSFSSLAAKLIRTFPSAPKALPATSATCSFSRSPSHQAALVVMPFDPRASAAEMSMVWVEEAAFSLGANPYHMARRVLLPLALPGVLAGSILTFILAMNAYATPVLLGGPRFMMMGPLVYNQFVQQNNWPFGASISFVLMAATIILTATANILVQRRYRR